MFSGRQVVLAFCFPALVTLALVRDSIIANTKYGTIEGEIFEKDHVKVDVFRGIPFAKPPLRELRFKKPQPLEPWKGIKKTRDYAPKCRQYQPLAKIVHDEPASEDCLYLNVFSPHEKDKAPYPVMVFIHGGGYYAGSPRDYGVSGIVENIVPSGVIFITIQYRLGPWGFYTTGTDAAVGNWGLWDNIAALEWIRDNIESFGGDPAKVTLFGQSAGSVSTSLLSLSTYSKDLFHQMILMSGSPFILVGKDHLAKYYSEKLAYILACDLPSPVQMTDCLRTKDSEQISEALKKITLISELQFVPVTDGDLFDDSFENLIEKATPKPTIIGNVENEMLLYSMMMPGGMPYGKFKERINAMIPDTVYKNGPLLRRLILHKYLHAVGDKKNEDFVAKQYTQLIGDFEMYAKSHKEVVLRRKSGSEVWLYSFDHYNEAAFPENITEKAAYHCLDLVYLFRENPLPLAMPEFEFDPLDNKISDRIVKLWTNFAKFGNPTKNDDHPVKWHELSEGKDYEFLSIKENSEMKTNYMKEATTFWNDLIPHIESFDKYSKSTGKLVPKVELVEEVTDDEDEWRHDEF